MKIDFIEKEGEIKKVCIHWFTPNGPVVRAELVEDRSQEPLLDFPCGNKEGSKDLGHPVSFSQATSKKLDQKWSSGDMNQCPYEMLVSEGG